MTVLSQEERAQLCPGPSGHGNCPYGLRATITYKAGYATDEKILAGQTVKATCRCGASVSFTVSREAYRRG
ncbi:MAG TPA: hypothetical protein VKI41_15325, partial [Vicinamibacteria bacterium]|nr:hypothetical protein [Vicinamibacteria bacterium]